MITTGVTTREGLSYGLPIIRVHSRIICGLKDGSEGGGGGGGKHLSFSVTSPRELVTVLIVRH